MAFKRLQDSYVYEQQQKKRLPYTITDIQSGEFKARQAQKELESKIRQAKKRAEVIKGMEDGSLAAKDAAGGYGESGTTKSYKRMMAQRVIREQESILRKLDEPKTPKTSLFTKIYNWCMDKFLSAQI